MTSRKGEAIKNRFIRQILALLLGFSLFLVPATASADEGTSQSEEQAGFTDAQVVELEQYLNTLFAEVVVKDEQTGQLHIDYDAAKRLYPDRDLSVLSIPASQLDTSSHNGAGPLDLKDYAWCVVKGAIPFIGLLDVNWGLSACGSVSRTGELFLGT